MTTLTTADLAPLADVFGDGMFAMQNGEHFTCSEADVVAELLAKSGHQDAAITWLIGHAAGDEEDDRHLHLKADRETDELRAAAAAYLTWTDRSDAQRPREVHQDHLDADMNHTPDPDSGGDNCTTCGLAVTSDGKRHGFDT